MTKIIEIDVMPNRVCLALKFSCNATKLKGTNDAQIYDPVLIGNGNVPNTGDEKYRNAGNKREASVFSNVRILAASRR